MSTNNDGDACNATELTLLVEHGGETHSSLGHNERNVPWKKRCNIMLCLLVGMIAAFSLFMLGRISAGAALPSRRPSIQSRAPSFTTTRSKYKRVQGIGFQIYTGGAPAYLKNDTRDHHHIANPECIGRYSYGQLEGEVHPHLQCYIGHDNATVDVAKRMKIMMDAMERAYSLADESNETLKVFIAPEFYWRGVSGAYQFLEEAPNDPNVCGPVCLMLQGLENITAKERFQDWLFVMGTVIASETLPKADPYDYLFYNFAPVFKGYNPERTRHVHPKRFLVPKRYVSSSDFLTPRRHLDPSIFKELIGEQLPEHDNTVYNPHDFDRRRYDYNTWDEYKEELNNLGYTMIEYDWFMVDGLSMTLEICLDHQMQTALNAYNGDMVAGRKTLIPSFSDDGLTYVHIPTYQAQVSIVSSAGMTVMPESLALTNSGTIFLQDGLSNDTGVMFWSEEECEAGLQFGGGTEAVTREAFLSVTDVIFEHQTLSNWKRHDLYANDWKEKINGTFSWALYPPQITIFGSVDIAKVDELIE